MVEVEGKVDVARENTKEVKRKVATVEGRLDALKGKGYSGG